jgi:hypothetical protein
MKKLALIALLAAGCGQPLSDVRLIVWQPLGLDADAFDGADEIVLTVDTDEDSREATFSSPEQVRVGGVAAPLGGGEVRFALRAGEAVGRAAVDVVPESPPIEATMVLAPPGVVHPHTEEPTDQRAGTTACLDPVGRLLIVSGRSGAALAPGSLVVDPVERRVRGGPSLEQPRQRAACVAGADVAWLFGGCDLNEADFGELLRADGLGEDDAFEVVASTPGGGCDASLALLEGGGLALNYGTQVEVRNSAGEVVSTALPLSPARFGATVVPFPGEDRFLVSGGRDVDGTPVTDSLVVRFDEGALVEVNTAPGILAAADGLGVFALDGDDILRINADATTVVEADAELPAGFVAARLAARDGVFTVFAEDGASARAAGEVLGAFNLPAARPGGYIFPDRGGALFFVGGGAPGVDVLVLDR